MKKLIKTINVCIMFSLVMVVTGCMNRGSSQDDQQENTTVESESKAEVSMGTEIQLLEDGLSSVRYDGEYGFDKFINQGGASKDNEVVEFMMNYISSDIKDLTFKENVFGCSTISVKSSDGDSLFGRNFDWSYCNALIVQSQPDNEYASISTVNMDFISGINLQQLPDNLQAMIALYAPLDGMNEKGLVISANMIQDKDTIDQNTDKPDLTTTTAIRLLLNRAGSVEEAVSLLEQYDLHASKGYIVHFAIADATGNSVVVEYVDNKMVVINTPIVTNFYLAEGAKNGVGTSQSHTRFDILAHLLEQSPQMQMEDVREALSSVSKRNFGEFASTEWSIVFNQSSGEVHYYHRENYENDYKFHVELR